MKDNIYINLRTGQTSPKIDLLFPDWQGSQERVAVFGAHDDDPLLGAGYAMAAAMEAGAQVYVVIFCKGDCGYSVPEERETIVETRRVENEQALARFGIPADHIIRLEYPDFSLASYVGYHLDDWRTGTFPQIIELVRKLKITRALIPNGYKEHADHTAAYAITAYDLVQAGDPVVVDIGKPNPVRTLLQYSVWADFSPEDALVTGEDNLTVRANLALAADPAVEDKVINAICAYSSQAAIIDNLVNARRERAVAGRCMELYMLVDTRPKLDYAPYRARIAPLVDGR